MLELSHMTNRINWARVLKVVTLKNEGKLNISQIARKTRMHRRQVQRLLSYAERADYPHTKV
jgi:ActR/RegA family two-component response regulator